MARGTVTMNPLSDAINPPEEAEAEREPGQGAFAEVVANSLRERVKQRDLTVSGSAVSSRSRCHARSWPIHRGFA